MLAKKNYLNLANRRNPVFGLVFILTSMQEGLQYHLPLSRNPVFGLVFILTSTAVILVFSGHSRNPVFGLVFILTMFTLTMLLTVNIVAIQYLAWFLF